MTIDSADLADWRRLTVALTHAECFYIGKPTNRDRFIEAAYYAMPRLLDEVDRLRADNANLKRGVRDLTEVACTRMSAETYHNLVAERDAALAMLEVVCEGDDDDSPNGHDTPDAARVRMRGAAHAVGIALASKRALERDAP